MCPRKAFGLTPTPEQCGRLPRRASGDFAREHCSVKVGEVKEGSDNYRVVEDPRTSSKNHHFVLVRLMGGGHDGLHVPPTKAVYTALGARPDRGYHSLGVASQVRKIPRYLHDSLTLFTNSNVTCNA